MVIKMVAPSKLVPAEYNPRKISADDYTALKESLSRFGFVDPLIVNKRTGTMVGGHQRLKAAKDLGIKSVPIVMVDLDEKSERELNVRLNRNTGQFDYDLLQQYYASEDLIDYGFSSFEIGVKDDDFLEQVEESEDFKIADVATETAEWSIRLTPEVRKSWVTWLQKFRREHRFETNEQVIKYLIK